ncbi:MAG TPA: hypothetical protein K8V08_05005 [Brevibacterium senegalense]|uniref:Uncharacterized protein n=1 Tax=Brevibacterium senegalense TaxID=1033736 RepID=A0A921SNF1_9MICO|nr:hypothetical protein [Brevibacterium senegalense]
MNDRLRDLLHAVFPPRERASKEERLAASDARAPKLLLAVTVIAALLLPVGSSVGNRLTGAVCSSTGCDQPVSVLPACEAVGRDRLMAGQMLAFSTTSIDGAQRASTYGDGQVEVAVDDPDRQDSVLLYAFPDSAAAQRWLLAGSSTATAAIDAGAGPAPAGVADGYRGAAGTIGLIGDTEQEPRATAQRTGPRDGVLGELEERDAVSGTSRRVTVLDLGTEAGSSPQPQAARFAAELGLTGLLSVSVTHAQGGTPQRVEIAGWGSEQWSLDALRAADSAGDQPSRALSLDDDGAVWRVYSLDLRRQTNATVFQAAWDTADAFGVEASAALQDRLAGDAIFAEATIATGPDAQPADLVESMGLSLVRSSADQAMETQIVDARSADLAVAGSQLQPLLSCEDPDAQADEEDAA